MATSGRLRRRTLAPIIVVCAALLLGVAPVSAASDDPFYGPHTGNRGVHTLIDNQSENNGVTCTYGANHKLKKMKITAPVVFAFDRTGGTDTQLVGQRYIVEYDPSTFTPGYQDWPDFAVSPWVKARATDATSARWASRTYTFGANVTDHPGYRVSVLMRWYFPSKTHVDGSALDVNKWYQVRSPLLGTEVGQIECYAVDND